MKKSLLLGILVVLILSVVLFFVFQKNKIGKNPKTQLTEQSQNKQADQKTEEVSDKPIEIASANGQLMEIKEYSIKILNFEKAKNNNIPEKMEENMEVYNINAKTPVTRGVEGKTKSGLYELKLGQPITVEYDKGNNDAISIIINRE